MLPTHLRDRALNVDKKNRCTNTPVKENTTLAISLIVVYGQYYLDG